MPPPLSAIRCGAYGQGAQKPMLTYDAEGNEIEDGETPENEKPPWRKELEKNARLGREALARADKAERALALRESGLDLTSPAGKLFADTYSGEATADAVKAKATEYGLLEAAPAEQSAEQKQEQAAYDAFNTTPAAGGDSQSEFDRALSELNISPFGADGQLDPAGKQKILDAVAKHNITVRKENPTGGIIPLGTPVSW